MVAPVYATDLTTLDECNTDTGYVEPTAAGWVDLNAESFGETDLYIQNTTCISSTAKTGVGATLFNNGSGVTIPTDGAFFVWMYWAAPNSLDTEANGGIRTIIGATPADFRAWIHGGKDTYIYGGWLNLATNPTITADYTLGTPGTTYQYFGWAYKALAVPGKGNPYVVDCMRYGRGQISAVNGDISSGYATCAGMAAKNDANDGTEGYNRWGLFQAIAGGYLWKGLMSLGTSGIAVDFRDSNVSITIDNTKKVTSGFNKIEVNNAASRVDWTGVSITALGTVSKGAFEAIANADINLDSCTFTGMSTFVFQSNSTTLNTIFRRCGQVTQGSGTFTGCTFEDSTATAALLVDSITSVTNCDFNSSGTGHAIQGFSAAGDYSVETLTFTDYASSDGSTGNEAIYVTATTGVVNLSCVGSPSVRTAGATVNKISGTVDAVITVKDTASPPVAIENARVLVWVTDNTNYFYQASVTITGSGTTATVSHTGHGMATGDKVIIEGVTNDDRYNGVFSITKINNDSYSYTTESTIVSSPATGTIKSTYCVIHDLTNAGGQVTKTKAWTLDQPIAGRVRKSTSAPYYQQGSITGSIDKDSGFATTVQMMSDA